MKKIGTLIIAMCFFLSHGNAQFDFDKLFIGANVGYAAPIGDFTKVAKGGLCYNLVGGYALTDKFKVGLEYDRALTAAITDGGGVLNVSIYGLSAFLAKGYYKFLESSFAPYAAVGLGLGQVSEPDITVQNVVTKGSDTFGLGASLELGFVFKGLNLAYSFNYSGNTPKEPIFNKSIGSVPTTFHRFSLGYLYNF